MNLLVMILTKMKKSQAESHMFVYIMTMVVIGVLLFLGTKWLLMLVDKGCDVEVIKMKKTIENQFEKIKYNRNSYEWVEFFIPCDDVEKVCFFDSEYAANGKYKTSGICTEGDDDFDLMLCDAWGTGETSIAFKPFLENTVYLEDVRVKDGYLCLDVDLGKIKVKLVGLGDGVLVQGE